MKPPNFLSIVIAVLGIATLVGGLATMRMTSEDCKHQQILTATSSAAENSKEAAAISNRTAASLSAAPSASVDKVEPRSIMRIHFPRDKELEFGARSLHLGRYPTEVAAKEAQTQFGAYITKCVNSSLTSDWAWWCHLDLLKRTKIEKDHGQWQLYLENVTVPEGMNLCAFLWVSPEMLEVPWARVPNNTCVFR
jgi:hypothetical protein